MFDVVHFCANYACNSNKIGNVTDPFMGLSIKTARPFTGVIPNAQNTQRRILPPKIGGGVERRGHSMKAWSAGGIPCRHFSDGEVVLVASQRRGRSSQVSAPEKIVSKPDSVFESKRFQCRRILFRLFPLAVEFDEGDQFTHPVFLPDPCFDLFSTAIQ